MSRERVLAGTDHVKVLGIGSMEMTGSTLDNVSGDPDRSSVHDGWSVAVPGATSEPGKG